MAKLRLKEILSEKGITQKELYESVGLSQVYVSEIIGNKKLPKIETLENIAKYLDVDIRELFEPTKEQTLKEVLTQIRNFADEAIKRADTLDNEKQKIQ